MKKPAWEDATSYSQREPFPKVPRMWALGSDNQNRVLLHRHISNHQAWFVSCYALGIEQQQLKAVELENVKLEAIAVVAAKFKALGAMYKKLGVLE